MEKHILEIGEIACLTVKANTVSKRKFHFVIDGNNLNLWVYSSKYGVKVVEHFSNHRGTSTGMFIKLARTYLRKEINIYKNNKKEGKA